MKSVSAYFQESFPFYLDSDRKNVLLAFFQCLFILGFMSLFFPQPGHNFIIMLIIVSVVFTVMCTSIIALPKFLPNWFHSENWNIGKHIFFCLIQCIIISLITPLLIHNLNGFMSQHNIWFTMYAFSIGTLIYGGMSILLVTIILRNIMLKKSLSNAMQANAELAKIYDLKHPAPSAEHAHHITLRSDTSETIDLRLTDLVYIESSHNYSTVFWKTETGLEKKILRIYLKNLEVQLNNSFIIRCHRSYIVNINAITHVTGNTNGYKLSLEGTEMTIPVSRAKGTEVIEKISQIRNLAEFA